MSLCEYQTSSQNGRTGYAVTEENIPLQPELPIDEYHIIQEETNFNEDPTSAVDIDDGTYAQYAKQSPDSHNSQQPGKPHQRQNRSWKIVCIISVVLLALSLIYIGVSEGLRLTDQQYDDSISNLTTTSTVIKEIFTVKTSDATSTSSSPVTPAKNGKKQPEWSVGNWGVCSKKCGGGKQYR